MIRLPSTDVPFKENLNEIFRPLQLFADGTQIADGYRFRAHGKGSMTLLPDLYLVDIYNLPEDDMAVLKRSSTLSVKHETIGVLCYGDIDDIYTYQQEANDITTVVVVDGKRFSELRVSKSIGPGASVRTAMASIIPSGYMGSFLASDTRLIRGQTFSGRLADCVSTLARAVNARAFLVHGAVIVVAKGQAEQKPVLEEEDVIDTPEYAEGTIVIRAHIVSISIGHLVNYGGRLLRLVAQSIDVDNLDGPWKMQLTLVNESSLSASGMEGG